MAGAYQDLQVWQSAMELTVNLHRTTAKFPPEEMQGLVSQLRRTAISVATDIAEGKSRSSNEELLQFLRRARRSIYEIQMQLDIAESLGYIEGTDQEHLGERARGVARQLNGMISKLRQTDRNTAA